MRKKIQKQLTDINRFLKNGSVDESFISIRVNEAIIYERVMPNIEYREYHIPIDMREYFSGQEWKKYEEDFREERVLSSLDRQEYILPRICFVAHYLLTDPKTFRSKKYRLEINHYATSNQIEFKELPC